MARKKTNWRLGKAKPASEWKLGKENWLWVEKEENGAWVLEKIAELLPDEGE